MGVRMALCACFRGRGADAEEEPSEAAIPREFQVRAVERGARRVRRRADARAP